MTPSHLIMPVGFPDATLHSIKARIILKMNNPSSELDNLLGAENGIRFRLRACSDYSDKFTKSVQKFGDTTESVEERYKQERYLFGFFVSGYAVFDSFSFFMYFAATPLKPSQFPTQKPRDIRNISCKNCAEILRRAVSG